MRFHPTASGTFVRVLSLISHAFFASRAICVASALFRCMFSLPYFRLRSLPLSPSLFAIPRFSWIFPRVARVGAARLRAAAARLREERLMGQDKGEASVGKAMVAGCWQVVPIAKFARYL